MTSCVVKLTISLSEETVQRLRKTVRSRYRGKKGALSGLIEESVRERLEELDVTSSPQTFRAIKGDRVLAEASSLDDLAAKLEKMEVNPRSVRIVSSKRLAPVVRAGLRGRKI